MIITFSPCRSDATLMLERQGDTLIVNGETFDFSPLADGDELPADAIDSDFVVGPVRREDGTLRLSILLPHAANAPDETRHPAPIEAAEDGPITLPQAEDHEA